MYICITKLINKTTAMKPTKRQFEEHLNQKFSSDSTGWNNRSGSRNRPYGTWLRSADKERFNVEFAEWVEEQFNKS